MLAGMNRPFMPNERPRSAIYVERAFIAAAKAAANLADRNPEAMAKRLWPRDTVTPALIRATTTPASTSGSGWADTLAPDMVADFVQSLAPMSVAARLIDAGMRIPLAGRNSVNIPRRVNGKPATDVSWIGQGAAIPVKPYALDAATLGPAKKLGLIVGMTRELVEHAGADTIIAQLMKEDIAASLDATMFSVTTGADQPSGLLAGLSAITASSATAKGDAMLEDMENLAGAVADGGGGSTVYVMHPKQERSARLRLWADAVIWPCLSLSAGTVIALDPTAFASGFGSEPRISASIEATPVYDTSAGQFSTVGTPPTMAAPILSTFQQDLVVLRVVLSCAWALRQAGVVAYLTGATWGGPAS